MSQLTGYKKRSIRMILLYGKQVNQGSLPGQAHGEMVDPVGILSAQSWHGIYFCVCADWGLSGGRLWCDTLVNDCGREGHSHSCVYTVTYWVVLLIFILVVQI